MDGSTHTDQEATPPDSELFTLYDMAISRKDILNHEASATIAGQMQSLDERYGPKVLVAQGGMKKIYRVEDLFTGRFVAMAMLDSTEKNNEYERFLREARLTATLEHPNILPIYDIGFNCNDQPFFTMKYTGDENLSQRINRFFSEKEEPKLWPLFERLTLFAGICEGICYAHSREILHLDLKPQNILVGKFGEVLICDWGLGKILSEPDLESGDDSAPDSIDPIFLHEYSLSGSLKGTPGFMAPEQIDKTIAPRSRQTDIFALGGILHTLLTGEPPFPGPSLEEVFENTKKGKINRELLNRHNIPAPLQAVLNKALSPDPDKRYSSSVTLREDILSYMGGFATSVENAGLLRNLTLLTKRYKAASILAGVLILLSFGFTAHLYYSQKKAHDLLALYTAARETHSQYRAVTEREMTRQAESTFANHAFKKTIVYAQQMVYVNPENKEAWFLMGLSYFHLQEFTAAAKAFQFASGIQKESPIPKLAEEYAKKKPDDEQMLSSEQLLELMNCLSASDQRNLFAKARLNYSDLRSHLPLVRRILAVTNPKQNPLHFGHEIEDDTVRLDLSGNSQLKDLFALKGLPISSLNLEGTAVTKGQLRHLEGMSLKELNIAGSSVRNFDFLKDLPDLKQVTVEKGRFSKNKLRTARKTVVVIEKTLE
jgi:serine/threonine protein kinase